MLIAYTGKTQNLPELFNEVKSSVIVIDVLSINPIPKEDNLTLGAKSAQGSGVLISEDGLIWTASHVVQSAEIVRVEFLDGDVYEAQVLSSNTLADVALLKIKKKFKLKDKKVAPIGNSDELKIGEDVFVVGAPLRLKQSLSKGILSGRHIPEGLSNDFVKVEFLQTDAAINSGNSGGPMFNMKGEVVGITSRIYSSSGGFNGIGFAVSSNIAKKLLMDEPNLWTGMESILVTGDPAKALNIPQESGLLVFKLSSKGAASKLGLKSGTIPAKINETELLIGGDIILNFADIKVEGTNFQTLIKQKLETLIKGDKFLITILRTGKIEVAELTKQ